MNSLNEDSLRRLIEQQQLQINQMTNMAMMNQRMNIASAGPSAFAMNPVLGLPAGRPMHTSPGFLSAAMEAYMLPKSAGTEPSTWLGWAGFQTHMTRAQAMESLRESVNARASSALKYFTTGRILNDIPLVGSMVARSEFGLNAMAGGIEPTARHWLASKYLSTIASGDIMNMSNENISKMSAFGRGLKADSQFMRELSQAFTASMKAYARETGMTIGAKEQQWLMQTGTAMFMDEGTRSSMIAKGPAEFGKFVTKTIPDKMLELKQKLNMTDADIDKFVSQYGNMFAGILNKVIDLPANLVKMSRADVPFSYGAEMYARNTSFAMQNVLGSRAGSTLAMQEAFILNRMNTPGTYLTPEYARTFQGRTSAERGQSMQNMMMQHTGGLLESSFGMMYGLAADTGGIPLGLGNMAGGAAATLGRDPLSAWRMQSDMNMRGRAFSGVRGAAIDLALGTLGGVNLGNIGTLSPENLKYQTNFAGMLYHSMFGAQTGLRPIDSQKLIESQIDHYKRINEKAKHLKMNLSPLQRKTLQSFIASGGMEELSTRIPSLLTLNQFDVEEQVLRGVDLLPDSAMQGTDEGNRTRLMTASTHLEALRPSYYYFGNESSKMMQREGFTDAQRAFFTDRYRVSAGDVGYAIDAVKQLVTDVKTATSDRQSMTDAARSQRADTLRPMYNDAKRRVDQMPPCTLKDQLTKALDASKQALDNLSGGIGTIRGVNTAAMDAVLNSKALRSSDDLELVQDMPAYMGTDYGFNGSKASIESDLDAMMKSVSSGRNLQSAGLASILSNKFQSITEVDAKERWNAYVGGLPGMDDAKKQKMWELVNKVKTAAGTDRAFAVTIGRLAANVKFDSKNTIPTVLDLLKDTNTTQALAAYANANFPVDLAQRRGIDPITGPPDDTRGHSSTKPLFVEVVNVVGSISFSPAGSSWGP